MTWELFWDVVGILIVIYMLSIILFYMFTMLFSFQVLYRNKNLESIVVDDDLNRNLYTKPVSILVPAYNEEVGVVNTIYSLINIKYPSSEIIIIDDGSKDKTAEKVIDTFDMELENLTQIGTLETKPVHSTYRSKIHNNIVLIRKENGGKADALNVGMNYSKFPYCCSIDGDSILDPYSLLKVMRPIIQSDGQVIAAGGNVRIANGHSVKRGLTEQVNSIRPPLIAFQIVEYLRAFLLSRVFLSRFNMVLIISGAFSVFNKNIAIKVGGYSTDIIGEDMELVVKLQKYIYETNSNQRIEFVPEPVCWTEAPTTFNVLRRQRRRWSQGLFESLWRHKDMAFNPKFKQVGMISVPYFWMFEALGAIVELLGYIYIILALLLDVVNIQIALILLVAMILYGTMFSILSILFEAWCTDKY